MTTDEVHQIESDLNLRIPEEWRRMITDKAFCEEFESSTLLLQYEDIMRENQLYRDSPYTSPYWNAAWLAIHADGCGNVYFLDTSNPASPIYDFDHEKTQPGYQPLQNPVFNNLYALLEDIREYGMK